jgi:metal-responsive CopG/Arc/MetJ family transcriptional regulator
MQRLRRTQIYLPADLTTALDDLARRRGVSRAELLRGAAYELLERESPADEDPILAIIGLGNAGPGSVSEEHDRFLVSLSPHTAS